VVNLTKNNHWVSNSGSTRQALAEFGDVANLTWLVRDGFLREVGAYRDSRLSGLRDNRAFTLDDVERVRHVNRRLLL
jgi:hypothetical protein